MDAGNIQITLVTSKTKVAPIKQLTIPRLKLHGAHHLAQLLSHIMEVSGLPIAQVSAWTVLNWLVVNPRQFKTHVSNRVSDITELTGPDHRNHVNGADNPADCASRGPFLSELLEHQLQWNGPDWLRLEPTAWPHKSTLP